jgi:hypothetical protein
MIARDRTDAVELALRAVVAGLTVATAAIHFSLGSLLFTMNGLAYATLAVALVAPIAMADRFRWLVRLALLGFTTMTIAGWVALGARYDVAYLDKGIELLLISLLLADIRRADGGIVASVRHFFGFALGLLTWRPAMAAEASPK